METENKKNEEKDKDTIETSEKGSDNISVKNPEFEILKAHTIDRAKEEADIILKIAREREKSMLEEAEKEREEILKEAYERIDRESKEAMEKAEALGYSEGNGKGYEEGYNTGYGEGKEKSDIIISEALEIKEGYISKNQTALKDLEEDIIDLVISSVKKILGDVEKERELIIDLVLNGIRSLDPTENLTIVVSKEDYDILMESKDLILAHGSLINKLDIKYDINMKKSDCILETEKGSIDVSLKDQLNEMEELLKNILANE